MAHFVVNEEARRFFFEQFVGFSLIPEDKVYEIYAKVLIICAKGDGELHPMERNWIIGLFACMGAPAHVMELVESYEGDDDPGELLQLTEVTARAAARNIIFDALQACEADGVLAKEELDSVYSVGELMGLTRRQVEQVHAAYDVYKSAMQNKFLTLFPVEPPPY